MLQTTHYVSSFCVPEHQYGLITVKGGNTDIGEPKVGKFGGTEKPVETDPEKQVKSDPFASLNGLGLGGSKHAGSQEGLENPGRDGHTAFPGNNTLP